ncbi:unnamed protein product [Caenorhabditis auriculariae]|uniref:Uncharacterized protein n=1 Tax=Caenorhabditis auriculariae TaxID=2777116 RepID=A0A8S1HU93_9PELO|nr:unnamed protein product [Caenorhabditis auriculariae]
MLALVKVVTRNASERPFGVSNVQARGTPGVPILFACELDTQSQAEAHSCGRSRNCWQRDTDKAMMGPPRKMPSRPSASRISSNKAERSSSAPPNSYNELVLFCPWRLNDNFK